MLFDWINAISKYHCFLCNRDVRTNTIDSRVIREYKWFEMEDSALAQVIVDSCCAQFHLDQRDASSIWLFYQYGPCYSSNIKSVFFQVLADSSQNPKTNLIRSEEEFHHQQNAVIDYSS